MSCAADRLGALRVTLSEILDPAAIPYKVVVNDASCAQLNRGGFGKALTGRCATIYPPDDATLIALVSKLIALGDFGGPDVSGAVALHGAVSLRYGRFGRGHGKPNNIRIVDVDGDLETGAAAEAVNMDRFNQDLKHRLGHRVKRPQSDIIGQILNHRYLVLSLLRQSAEATFYQAIDTHAAQSVRPIVLREVALGPRRSPDIYAQLKHQEMMHYCVTDLAVAPPCDLVFTSGHTAYLPMECPNGTDFATRVKSTLNGLKWLAASQNQQRQLLHMLGKICSALGKLHAAGISHGNLKPSQILLTDTDTVLFTDLGLSRLAEDTRRQPPLDDVAAFAGLCLFALTGFWHSSSRRVDMQPDWAQVRTFTNTINESLWDLIQARLDPSCQRAPNLADFSVALKCALTIPKPRPSGPRFDRYEGALHRGVKSLLRPEMQDDRGIWTSHQGTHRSLHDGVAGVLYFLADYARHFTLPAELQDQIQLNADWLMSDTAAPDKNMPGLHFGETGALLALTKADDARLIDLPYAQIPTRLDRIKQTRSDWPDLTYGLAGIAMGLDQIAHPDAFGVVRDTLEMLAARQGGMGLFAFPGKIDPLPGETLMGFAQGNAGIAFALARLAGRFDAGLLEPAKATADALLDLTIPTSDGGLSWCYPDTKGGYATWWQNGAPGMSYLFGTLYRATGAGRYRHAAINCLTGQHPALNPAHLSLQHGLAGNGIALLDGYENTGDQRLRATALAYADTLLARAYHGSFDQLWLGKAASAPTPGLMVGNAGVLQFLLRVVCDDPTVGIPGCNAAPFHQT